MNKIPLTWLQAFEAAGRTGSFKAAAEELNVSPSNISHQIRDLESYLGILLFSRHGRQVHLTEEGQNYLPALTQGFQAIRQASPTQRETTGQLQIGAFPFLANEIITPNLQALKSRLPETDIRLFTYTELSALSEVSPEERLDVVIRYGDSSKPFPGYARTKIGDVVLVPVIGPNTASTQSVDALLSEPLIRVIGPFQGWDLWREAYAPDRDQLSYALETDSFHAAMLAVERGEGVCLAMLPYLRPWIREGRIQPVSDLNLPVPDQAAFAVTAPHQKTNTKITAFVDWLVEYLA